MATNQDNLDEGVDYTITINTSVDTSGETLTAKLFEVNGSNSWSVGTVSGASADTDISLTLALKDRSPGFYYLEVWMDINDTNNSRDLIVPDEADTRIIRIKDREAVSN